MITADEPDLEDPSVEPPEPADVTDVDIFEELLCGNSTITPADQLTVDLTLEDLPHELDETAVGDQANTAAPETGSPVVIDRFPFGCPGAPIHRRLHTSESQQATFTDYPWAPFRSQLDWDVARWAKMRGQTSTAVSELLAIPGV
jgi:hypothetical protein